MVNMSYALLFPGQGAQFVGMGKDFYSASPAAKKVFQNADETLGFSISEICFDGPENSLTKTDLAQPAIYVCSMAALAAVQEIQGHFTILGAAGLSLGEYTALAAAEAFSFEDGLRLVRLRGLAMQEASDQCDSGMTSVMGLDQPTLENICQQASQSSQGICQIANLNCPGQIVVSGETHALDIMETYAKEAGARRAIRLTVAGAFHSEVMRPAAEKLKDALLQTHFSKPLCPVWQNVSAQPATDGEAIRAGLVAQLTAPVLWQASFLDMVDSFPGATFLEPAPGKVLAGLARKIDSEIKVVSIPTLDSLQALTPTPS